jgi:4,5-dihydroxyphthalate decarboxylase
MLQHEYGVNLDEIEWYLWTPHARMEMELPKRYKVKRITPDRKPDQMFFDGELDAIMVPSLFPSLFNPPPHIRRLFEDAPKVEAEYYKRTGIFPIMHSVALRQNVWEEHPVDRAQSLQGVSARKGGGLRAIEDLSPYKISLAWFRGPVEEQERILGNDPWPYGLEKNRDVVETLATYLYEQGLADRKMPVEELFAPNTLDL